MKQYFKIGEISRLYQISVDTLRYYEELGLLTPKRGANGYRLYRLNDIWRLNVIRDLRGLGFPMEQIKEYLNDRSIQTTERLLRAERNVIRQKIMHLQSLQSNVEERLATIQKARKQPLDTVIEKKFPLRFCHIIHSGYQKDEEMDVLMKQLLNQTKNQLYIIGSNNIGSVLPVSSAKAGHVRDYSAVFLIAEDGTDTFPEGIYLSYSYCGDTEKNSEVIPQLFSYADKHGYIPDDQILELLWVDIHQSSDPQEYITELQLHVRKHI